MGPHPPLIDVIKAKLLHPVFKNIGVFMPDFLFCFDFFNFSRDNYLSFFRA